MEKESLNDTLLLCDFSHLYNSFVQISTVFIVILEPPSITFILCTLYVRCIAVFVEKINTLSANRHVRHSDLDAIREIFNHRATKNIDNADLGFAMAHWRSRRVELAHFLIRMVRRTQHKEPGIRLFIFAGDRCLSGHIGLPVSQVNVQIRVLRKAKRRRKHRKKQEFPHGEFSKKNTNRYLK